VQSTMALKGEKGAGKKEAGNGEKYRIEVTEK
jgi:hypothetical protein